jgi:methionyl-tRNA formyltransferase
MRIVMMGQAAFGEAAFARLRADGREIVGVSAPTPREGVADPLWSAAEAAGLAPIPTVELKTDGGMARWRDLRPDLCVMAFVTVILPVAVFSIPEQGTIQYHPSLLPLHRGSSSINWAIINGDAETGVTIFWPDQGVDSGPILLQKRVAIGPDDTAGSLYFDRLFPAGVDALSESVSLVESGRAPSREQDHAAATNEPPYRDEWAEIRWHESAARIYSLIRGCNPRPGAWTRFRGGQLRIFDARLTGGLEPGMPGRILRLSADGFDVRLNGGVLHIARVQPEGEKKQPANEWAARAGIAPGTHLR